IHLRRVAEAEDAAEMLLCDGRADLAWRCTDDRRGLPRERVLAVRSARPVDGVLQRTGDRAVVLRGHEQHVVDRSDRVLERFGYPRVVIVVIAVIERQILDRYLR